MASADAAFVSGRATLQELAGRHLWMHVNVHGGLR
jgi:hypothetical protein